MDNFIFLFDRINMIDKMS